MISRRRLREFRGWPPGLELALELCERRLLLALYVRAVWDLCPDLGLPALAPAARRGASARPIGDAAWDRRWLDHWRHHLDWHARRPAGPSQATAAPGREPYPAPPTGPPSWLEEYGDAGIDTAAFEAWVTQSSPLAESAVPDPGPEFACLAALERAWDGGRGLRTVVALPFDGFVAHWLGRHVLLTSHATRSDPDLYGRALAEPG